jgi:hypothetical protein
MHQCHSNADTARERRHAQLRRLLKIACETQTHLLNLHPKRSDLAKDENDACTEGQARIDYALEEVKRLAHGVPWRRSVSVRYQRKYGEEEQEGKTKRKRED